MEDQRVRYFLVFFSLSHSKEKEGRTTRILRRARRAVPGRQNTSDRKPPEYEISTAVKLYPGTCYAPTVALVLPG